MRKEIYEKAKVAIAALLKQNDRSVKPHSEKCLYNAPNGNHCVIGWMINDPTNTQLDDNEDDSSINNPIVQLALAKACGIESINALELKALLQLQRVHDYYQPQDWPDMLNEWLKDNKPEE